MKDFIMLHLSNGNTFAPCCARILRCGKKRRVQIETRNALCCRRDWKGENFIIQVYSRRDDAGTRLKPSVLQEAVQESQRFRRDEFTANFLPGKMVFFQEQHFCSCTRGGNRARRACRSCADNDQIILGCFQTITPMRKRKNFLISMFSAAATGASILLISSTV